jgi:hypothetical protein
MLARGMAWLSRAVRLHAAIPVLYERPADGERKRARRVTVMAVLGRPEGVGEASIEPVRVDAEAVDFLISAADLVFGRQAVEPKPDDRVYLKRDGRTLIYEILPRTGGSPPWRWSDPQRTIRRIHAKLIDE